MSHGLESVEAPLRDLPATVELAFALVTHLGDTWLVFLLVGGLYLFAGRLRSFGAGYDRRDGAVVLALAIASMAAAVGLKSVFAHPRPPGAGVPADVALLPRGVRAAVGSLATADGYSLPSGHALQTTVVYGGLALTVDAGRRWQRALAAATLVGLVAVSRVVIGVHYLLDVVAGVGAGAVLLGAIWLLAADSPGRALMAAVAVALGAVLAAGFAVSPLALLGAAIGARLAWGIAGGDVAVRPTGRRESWLLVALGVPLLGGLVALTVAMEVAPGGPEAVVAGFLVAGATVGALVALPAVVRSRESPDRRPGRAGEAGPRDR